MWLPQEGPARQGSCLCRLSDMSELVRKLEELRDRAARTAEMSVALERARPTASPFLLPEEPPALLGEPDPFPGKRVLVADDDAAMRRLFETLARRERIECDTVANGSEAVAALKHREYALLFLDIMMPRVDGWGVLDYLRTHAQSRASSLFIITSVLDQAVSAADRELVRGIIYKPIDAGEIAALMRQCMRDGRADGVLQKTRHRLLGPVM
jgi:CheY-like chemotaxis protein